MTTAISFRCACGEEILAHRELAGRPGVCPACRAVVTVPAPAPAPLLPLELPGELPPAATGDLAPCPACAEPIRREARRCRFCGEVMDPALARFERRARDASPGEGPSIARRVAWAGLVLAVAVAAILYRLLVVGRLEQTSALFIGLPASLALLLVLLPRPGSATGTILKGITLLLLLSAPLLQEGFVCVLMAAPIFYLVGIVVGLVADASGARARRAYLVGLPLVALALEGVHERTSLPREEEVTVIRVVARSAEEVERALERTPRTDVRPGAFLRLGFPRPVRAAGSGLARGDRRTIHFAGGEGKPGDLVLEVAAREPGRVLFRALHDTSHVRHWLEWKESEVRWEALSDGRTRVTWRLAYRRCLDPAWYFAPLERHGAREAARALVAWVEAQ